jgi:alpha-L-fucosidase 2
MALKPGSHFLKPFLLFLLLAGLAGSGAARAAAPSADLNLELAAPVNSWDEAVPLGNGLMGELLYGATNHIVLGLDRGDLWDERPNGEPQWWKSRTWAKGGDWDTPYDGASPTKLPAGHVEITLADGQKITRYGLNYATAEGTAIGDALCVRTFVSAVAPVMMMRIPGPAPKRIEVLSPLEVCRERNGGEAGPDSHSVNALGYVEAKTGSMAVVGGEAKWYVQTAAEGLKYCVCAQSQRLANETVLAIAITSTKDGTDPLALARQRCANALASGYEAMLKPHEAWWDSFWAQSDVTVPERRIEQNYIFARYLYGAGSRRGAPPMPLQGVWTANNGSLPPWKGDYHNDLNTQMTYIAYQTAGSFEEGESYLDYLWNLTPVFRTFAKDFYGVTGLATPGVMSLAGQPLGGWGQYSLSPAMTAWNAHLFYLHWRYTMDDVFLRQRAYPWCSAAGECLAGLLHPDTNGVLTLLRSSSPEVFDNSEQAWLQPNSNFDLACLKMFFLALQEMADAQHKAGDAAKWAKLAAGLGDFHATTNGMLLLDAKTPLPYSHRHLSNIIGLYPFNLITTESGAEETRHIQPSLAQWDKLGTSGWCGYTWAWMSCLRSRTGDAEKALRDLDVFVQAFTLRNGFHANGDQTKSGFSGFTYRPFTLEGNFIAMQAVQKMLLQSWSPTPGKRDTGVLRIFPAMPWRWHDAKFTDLRGEGGYKVSAKRENNATVWLRIVAGVDGIARVRDNFGGRAPRWNRDGVVKVGENYEVRLKRGETLEAVLAKPDALLPMPANAAQPVKLKEK